jgi:phosphatidylinositol alpha-1,6-mannosyltransferase
MCGRALIEAGIDTQLITFLDKHGEVAGRAAQPCHGSKALFAARIHAATILRERVLYDSVGLARAHPVVPWPRRSFGLWMHGLEVWEGLSTNYARAIRRPDLVFANSHYTLSRHEGKHGCLRTGRVCWLATEQDTPPDARANFDGRPTVLIVGRLEESEGWKGHDDLIRCWPKVTAAVPRAQLIIVGGGTGLGTMRDKVRASSASSSIDVLGFVPESRMPALFKEAHVFAMPSRQEGFGIVYVEAMRYGLPVIASVYDAGQEINVDGQTGFNIDLSYSGTLAERLIELLRNTDRAAAMGEAAFRRWQQHFRYSQFALRFLAHWLAA